MMPSSILYWEVTYYFLINFGHAYFQSISQEISSFTSPKEKKYGIFPAKYTLDGPSYPKALDSK
jgi:hypothetical protein